MPYLSRPALFGNGVEECKEPVELFLADRVELVAMAAGAGQCQAQPHGRGRIDAIDDVFDGVFFGDDPPFAVAAMVAVEAGGDLLVER